MPETPGKTAAKREKRGIGLGGVDAVKIAVGRSKKKPFIIIPLRKAGGLLNWLVSKDIIIMVKKRAGGASIDQGAGRGEGAKSASFSKPESTGPTVGAKKPWLLPGR